MMRVASAALLAPLALGALGAMPLPAQTVGGIVRDARTGAVVQHASVLLRDATDSTVALARSDSLGMFYLAAPAPGTYSLSLGYGSGPEHVGAAIVLADAEAFHQAEYAIEVHPDAPFLDFQVDTTAAPLDVVAPRYPIRLLDERITGHVVVQYVVGTNGRVDDEGVRVVEATRPEFGAAIPDALRRLRFQPASIAGRPVRQFVRERYTFTFVNRTPAIRIAREPASGPPATARPPR